MFMDVQKLLDGDSSTEGFEKSLLSLDSEFEFKCRHCGKCCVHQETIILTARDIFRIAQKQNRSMFDVIRNYTEVYLGGSSLAPIVHLLPNGPGGTCPLLGADKRCTVHDCKPTVCALYPLGRVLVNEDLGKPLTANSPLQVRYILNDYNCGSRKKKHTVREWLSEFGIPEQDDFFLLWMKILLQVGEVIQNKVGRGKPVDSNNLPADVNKAMWEQIFPLLFVCYDIQQDFMEQFTCNMELVKAVLNGLNS